MNHERSVLVVQVAVLIIIVIVASVNLTIGSEKYFDIWLNILTSSLALIIPFPINVRRRV